MKWTFGELDDAKWDAFERAHPDNQFLQGVQRIAKRAKMGYQSYIVGVSETENIIGGGVLMGRNGEFWMAYGPLLDWDNEELVGFFLDKLVAFARSKNMLKIEVFPRVLLSTRDNKGDVIERWDLSAIKKQFATAGFTYQGETTSYQMKAGRWAFTKDLSGISNTDELRASYRKTLRARLRQTEGQVEIEQLDRDHLETMVGLIDESDMHNGVKGRELEYYRLMFDSYGDDIKFLVARKTDDNTPIAGAIFIYHQNEVSSFLSGMNREFRDLNGRAWLQDFVMIDALKRGINRVNFFWIEGNFNNNHLLEFKSGFGGVVEEYVGGFEIVINKPKYMVKCIMRKGRALARRVRQIPSRLRH